MYKVFVVEDEPLIRQNLRAAVETAGAPFNFCGEASDGEMALSMMMDLQPDILVTDVKMPFMDGLELSRHAKAMMPWLKILIISGHDEFEYAQEAIEIGVDQYLLKPIRQKDLADALSTAAQQLDEQRTRSSLSKEYNEEELRFALYSQLMNQLFFGGSSTAKLLEDAKHLGMELLHNCYQVVVFAVESDGEPPESRLVSTKIEELDEQGAPAFFLLHGSDRIIALVYDSDPETINEKSYQIVKMIYHELEEADLTVTTVVGNIVSRISSIQDAYRAANNLLKQAGGVRTGRVLDLNNPTQNPESVLPGGKTFASICEKRLQYASSEEVEEILQSFLGVLEEEQLNSLLYRYYLLMDMVHTCVRVVAAANQSADPKAISRELGGWFDPLTSATSRANFEQTALELLNRTVHLRQTHLQESRGDGVIARATTFIQENYGDPDISLHMVAKHVGFSPAHFSMVFSQKTGTTFIDYLTGVRIDKAKELLASTDRKLSNIALEIGYNEPNYFSYVFRKRVGVSPKEFRARQQSGT